MIPECSCKGEVVKNSAGGNEFYFCRGCKQEVMEQADPTNEGWPPTYDFTFSQHVSPTPTAPTQAPLLHDWNYATDRCDRCQIDGMQWQSKGFPSCCP